jgi:hypothetical protein
MKWRQIETAPKDGQWFVIWANGRPEVGRYNPAYWTEYEPVEDGLFRARETRIAEWEGFNNFPAATCWIPIPKPERGIGE